MKKFDSDYYNKDYYNGKGSCYDKYSWEKEKDKVRRQAKRTKEIFNPNKVLDIGCALGFTMKALEEQGIEAHGCDISEVATKENMKVCDIRDGLPYQDDEFDVVFTNSTFEHIDMEYIPRVMKDVYRIAKKGFYLKVPVGLQDFNDPWGDPSHVTYMPPSYWIAKAYEVGWLLDIRDSEHKGHLQFQNVNLAFFKNRLSNKRED